MREGKFIEDLFERVKAVPDEKGMDLNEWLQLANKAANDHPVWYERFFWRSTFERGWKWVTSKTCSAISRLSEKIGGSTGKG